ncbi:hypothetical protein GCM10009818_36490 [Nakamurella flavida]
MVVSDAGGAVGAEMLPHQPAELGHSHAATIRAPTGAPVRRSACTSRSVLAGLTAPGPALRHAGRVSRVEHLYV